MADIVSRRYKELGSRQKAGGTPPLCIDERFAAE